MYILMKEPVGSVEMYTETEECWRVAREKCSSRIILVFALIPDRNRQKNFWDPETTDITKWLNEYWLMNCRRRELFSHLTIIEDNERKISPLIAQPSNYCLCPKQAKDSGTTDWLTEMVVISTLICQIILILFNNRPLSLSERYIMYYLSF